MRTTAHRGENRAVALAHHGTPVRDDPSVRQVERLQPDPPIQIRGLKCRRDVNAVFDARAQFVPRRVALVGHRDTAIDDCQIVCHAGNLSARPADVRAWRRGSHYNVGSPRDRSGRLTG